MKTYFAQWNPVEGEIKDTDPAWWFAGEIQLREEMSKIMTVHSAKIMNFNNKNYKPVKLFLCGRRDIQVGDTTTFEGDDTPVELLPKVEDKRHLEIITHPEAKFFKVIGEISPHAKWVKQGDEFDVDELCVLHTNMHGEITPTSPDKIHPPFNEDEFKKLGYAKIGILGKCGHFH